MLPIGDIRADELSLLLAPLNEIVDYSLNAGIVLT
jgi:hypothetical protein